MLKQRVNLDRELPMIRIWKHLHKVKAQETQAENELRKKYSEFLSVLFENEYSLDLMTRLEEKLYNNQLISFPYLKAMIDKLSKHVTNIIESLIHLSDGEHALLREVNGRLNKEIRHVLTGSKEPVYTPMIIPLAAIKKGMVDKVGNKMANLGDMRNYCNQLVPDGFAATACAYNYFMEYNGLSAKIRDVLCDLEPENSHQLMETEKALKKLFLEAEMPPEIEHSILQESEKIEKKKGHALYWAVRSSAIGEDLAESSFAGQFSTILNVRTDQLLQTYKEVASSKYNASVIVYQRMRNIRDDDVAMSVGFMEMIDPVCSGVMYSMNPVEPGNDEIVINAVWGVGELLVEGIVSADVYVLKRDAGFTLVREETAEKEVCLARVNGGGLEQQVMPKDKSCLRCLSEEQLKRLARMALRIEKHFNGPQDIEWCFDQRDRLYMLQARPLRIIERAERTVPVPAFEAPVIAADTQPISPGIGWGKVFKARSVHDLTALPQGAVLVLKHSSPRFIGAFRKVAAVVVEKGNWTDHMASVIREFGVPCLVRVAGIFDTLNDGREITVDADNGVIYEGIVPALQRENVCLPGKSVDMPITESHRLLENMAEHIFPLHLTDPRQADFAAAACRSWHDILRFCHETALNEMFFLKEKSRLHAVKNVFKVATDLPIILYVLDIMGNSIRGNRSHVIDGTDVTSLPFQKLWDGMTDPAVNWKGPDRGMQAKDLLSAMLRSPMYAANQAADSRSYAVVAPEYLNLSLSLGYHYIVLDCYLSDDVYNNYISLSFKGGAAEAKKRNLRVAFVSEVLKHMDFYVVTTSDFLKARLKAESAQELGKKLYSIGHILGVTRLLDLAMEDEQMVARCVARFEAHDYSLGLGEDG
jgi:pyruvate, water dikinase